MNPTRHCRWFHPIKTQLKQAVSLDSNRLRCLSTTNVVTQTDKPEKELDNKLERAQETRLKTKYRDPNYLDKYEIPNEDADIPKKHVFQQFKYYLSNNPCLTLEEAAQPCYPDSLRRVFKYHYLFKQSGLLEHGLRSYDNEYSLVSQFPDLTDMFIVGSDLVGSAAAYYCKKHLSRVGDVVVVDKEPYSPHTCTAISNGLISCQSKSRDISRMAVLTKELIRTLTHDIVTTPDDMAQIKYRPCTHLILWPEREVADVLKATENQIADGCYTETKLPHELEARFSFLKVIDSDVALGTHGCQDEALIDPIGLRNVYRTLAQAHGAHFIQAEAVDFNMQYHVDYTELTPWSAGAMVCRMTSGQLKSVCYAKTLLSLGHNTPFLESKAELPANYRESMGDIHFLQPKMRICFIFKSIMAPTINFPVITDTDGTMLLRDDYAGTFKYYLTIEESERFLDDDSDMFMDLESDEPFVNLFHTSQMFREYFDNIVKPKLVKRIPIMEDAEFVMANSGFENHNTHDASPLISLHPFQTKILLSGGYGKRLSSFGPVAGAALAELLAFDREETFDVTPFYWDRLLKGAKIDEFESLVN